VSASVKRKIPPYPVFTFAGTLTDDTITTVLGIKLTAKEVDDILLRNFEQNLEAGNEIMRRLRAEADSKKH
jgi:hypothetical protein